VKELKRERGDPKHTSKMCEESQLLEVDFLILSGNGKEENVYYCTIHLHDRIEDTLGRNV